MPVHREDQPRFRPGFVHRNSHQAGNYNHHQGQINSFTGLNARGGLKTVLKKVIYWTTAPRPTADGPSVQKKKKRICFLGRRFSEKKKRIRFLGRRFDFFLRFSLPNQDFFSNMVLVFIKKIVTSRSDDPLGKSMLVKHDKAHARGGRRFKRASSDGARRGSGT